MDPIKTAVVVFVKTPTVSEVKPMLARQVGREEAARFYELCCNKIKSDLRQLIDEDQNISGYWAVAEYEARAVEAWSDFPVLLQGHGPMEDRLANVYQQVMHELQMDRCLFVSADTPHVNIEDYRQLLNYELGEREVLFGPNRTGGFYAFVTRNREVPKPVWSGVRYGHSETLRDIVNNFKMAKYSVRFFDPNFYVKDLHDIRSSNRLLQKNSQPCSAKQELLNWAEGHLARLDESP